MADSLIHLTDEFMPRAASALTAMRDIAEFVQRRRFFATSQHAATLMAYGIYSGP